MASSTEFLDWAFVALFYSAHQQVHSVLSGEPELPKDERHPRKHTSHFNAKDGGRGTNQLVGAYMSAIQTDYLNLFEASHRTRYETQLLGADAYPQMLAKLDRIEQYCELVNRFREDIDTQAP